MSVGLRGKKYHYRFMLAGKIHSGVCENCTTTRQAEAFEAKERAALTQANADIRHHRSVRALVEDFRYELTGGKPVTIAEAYELAVAKPARRESRSSYAGLRKSYWGDFAAYVAATYPDLKVLSDVRRAHCEAYVKYLTGHGRFNTAAGRGISAKTVKEIAGVCRWVFKCLEEDAGLVGNPWTSVVLPAQRPIAREVFTPEELRLIWDGIQVNPFCYVLFFVAANSGLTEGDICTLEWTDIDWANGFLRRDRRKTGTEIGLPLLPELAEYIREQPRRGQYIFPEHAKMYLSQPSCVSARVTSFLHGLGIITTVEVPGRRAVSIKDLHSMRHVFAYRAKRAGIPESVIKKFIGHKVLAMTQHYADHDTAEELRAEIKKLPPLFVGEAGGLLEADSARRELAEMAYSLPLEKVEFLLTLARGQRG